MRIPIEIIKIMTIEAKKFVQALPPITHCFAFEFCVNPLALDYYFIRYVEVDMTDPGHVKDKFGYLCFNTKGQRLECEPIFDYHAEEVEFSNSFIVLQKFDKLP